MGKTQSELLFEQYLVAQGLLEFEFEKSFPGVAQKPDYSLKHRRGTILLEVKEFKQPVNLVRSGATAFDPFPQIREKINAGSRKFRNLKGYPCCLVLHNLGNPFVSIDEPMMVWGSMLGNPGVSVPIDVVKGEAVHAKSKRIFTTGGKMLRYRGDRPIAAQNTTIGAIIVLSHLALGPRKFHARYFSELDKEPKPKDKFVKCLALLQQVRGTDCDASLRVLRVVVHENPYAAIRLPRSIFQGPYDERYSTGNDYSVQRVFVGRELSKLELEEREAGVPRSPVSRLFQEDRSK